MQPDRVLGILSDAEIESTSSSDLERELAEQAKRDLCECGRRGCTMWPDCVLDAREADRGGSDADPGL